MSILISPTLANDSTPYYALASSAGVSQIVAGSNITLSPSGGTGAVTIAATPSVMTFQGSASLAYTDAIASAGPNVATLATITLSQAVNYAQITWGAVGVAGNNPEVLSAGGDASTACYIYLSASTGILDPTTSFGAFEFIPKDGTGETSVKLPSTVAQVPGATFPSVVMSATSATPTTTWYMSMYNVAYASNVYINAATSTTQAYSIIGLVTN